MELNVQELFSIIGDKECQIFLLRRERDQIVQMYNELNEKYQKLLEEKQNG